MTSLAPRAKYVPAEQWMFMPSAFKAMHMVGRTTMHQPPVTQAEVDALREEHGSLWPWPMRLSISQQLDLIASSILRTSRRDDPKNHHLRNDFYSLDQAGRRARRELPFTPEGLDVIFQIARGHRRRLGNRIADKPWDRLGDHLYVRSHAS